MWADTTVTRRAYAKTLVILNDVGKEVLPNIAMRETEPNGKKNNPALWQSHKENLDYWRKFSLFILRCRQFTALKWRQLALGGSALKTVKFQCRTLAWLPFSRAGVRAEEASVRSCLAPHLLAAGGLVPAWPDKALQGRDTSKYWTSKSFFCNTCSSEKCNHSSNLPNHCKRILVCKVQLQDHTCRSPELLFHLQIQIGCCCSLVTFFCRLQ